ncbi:MAG: hypothetical protein ACT4TC_26065 [Myxococcaceae bacterium]
MNSKLLCCVSVAALGVLFAGCSQTPAVPEVADGGGQTNGTSRTLTVTRSAIVVSAAGKVATPETVAPEKVSVLVPTPSGFAEYPAKANADGSVRIEGVPAGKVYLRYGTEYLVTDKNEVDLSYAQTSRRNLVRTDRDTKLSLDAVGLVPWMKGDGIDVTAPGSDYFLWSPDGLDAQSTAPLADATSHRWTANYVQAFNRSQGGTDAPIIDQDPVYLTQQREHTVQLTDGGTLPYRAAVAVSKPAAFTVAAGSETVVSANFVQLPPWNVELTWNRAKFTELQNSVHPSAYSSFEALYVLAMPFTADHGIYSATPDLIRLEPDLIGSAKETPVISGTFRYSKPYPDSWPLVGTVTQRFATQYGSRNDGTDLIAASAEISFAASLDEFARGTLQPRISPVRHVQIDGKDGDTEAVLGDGVHTISWDAPALGKATYYRVELVQLTRVPGANTQRQYLATFVTTDREVRIPANLWKPASAHHLIITACHAPGAQPELRAFLWTLPEARAGHLTGLLRTK